MRNYQEIYSEIERASQTADVAQLNALADEILVLGTTQAIGASEYARGLGYEFTSSHPRALEHYARALESFEAAADNRGVSRALNGMGLIHYYNGNFPRALELFRKCLSIHEKGEYKIAMAGPTNNIGMVLGAMGDYASALEYYQKAHDIYEAGGIRIGEANTLLNLGNIHWLNGNADKELEHAKRSLAVYEELQIPAAIGRAIGNTVLAMIHTNMIDEAELLLEHQAKMNMEDADVRLLHFAAKSEIAKHRDQRDLSKEYMEMALSIAQEAGLRHRETEIHSALREMARTNNDFDAFIAHNTEFQRIADEIRGREATQKIAMMEAERKIESELRERDKERALLYGALPKAIADRMLRGEIVAGDHHNNSSVLFLDIVGFTTMSDTMPPNEVVAMLGDVFAVLDGVSSAHGITKIKTIGDSYMAVGF